MATDIEMPELWGNTCSLKVHITGKEKDSDGFKCCWEKEYIDLFKVK